MAGFAEGLGTVSLDVETGNENVPVLETFRANNWVNVIGLPTHVNTAADLEGRQVMSHETIYKWIWQDKIDGERFGCTSEEPANSGASVMRHTTVVDGWRARR